MSQQLFNDMFLPAGPPDENGLVVDIVVVVVVTVVVAVVAT